VQRAGTATVAAAIGALGYRGAPPWNACV